MERIALTVQHADSIHHAGKGRLDAASNKGRAATSKAQAFLFGWDHASAVPLSSGTKNSLTRRCHCEARVPLSFMTPPSSRKTISRAVTLLSRSHCRTLLIVKDRMRNDSTGISFCLD